MELKISDKKLTRLLWKYFEKGKYNDYEKNIFVDIKKDIERLRIK